MLYVYMASFTHLLGITYGVFLPLCCSQKDLLSQWRFIKSTGSLRARDWLIGKGGGRWWHLHYHEQWHRIETDKRSQYIFTLDLSISEFPKIFYIHSYVNLFQSINQSNFPNFIVFYYFRQYLIVKGLIMFFSGYSGNPCWDLKKNILTETDGFNNQEQTERHNIRSVRNEPAYFW